MVDIQLFLGDCLDILPTLPDKSVDAIITDLPYGTTACKWDVIIPLEPMWEQVKRLCKGAFVTTASQPFTSVLVGSNLRMFKHEWIWEKDKPSNFALANLQPMKYHENICVFSRNRHTYNKQMIERSIGGRARCKYPVDHSNRTQQGISVENSLKNGQTFYSQELKNPSTLIRFSTGRRQDLIHPTQKPVALYEYLIRTYTNEGDTVMDFCMGSGTTGVACVKTGRNFIGIEKEKKYFEIAEKRIEESKHA